MADLETAQTEAVITHPLSTIYGQYVVTLDGVPRLVTARAEVLFEDLEDLSYSDAARVRVLLVSGEEMVEPDDITALVWEAMTDHYARSVATHGFSGDWPLFVECTGYSDLGFVEFGFDEHAPDLPREYRRRRADLTAREQRIAAARAESEAAPLMQAAE